MKKILCLTLSLLMLFTIISACTPLDEPGDTAQPGSDTPSLGDEQPAVDLPSDKVYDLDIMMWSGSGEYLTDIGNKEWKPEDIRGQNDAAAIAVAREFNKLYPNVRINIWAKSGDPNGDGVTWAQELENFRAEHGKYPDFYCTTDMVGDIIKGLIADLSQFEDDPMFQSFNPGVMNMMKYNGRQFALPQYLLPWGVFVNKTLAENNNIDVPDPNWNMDQYTAFVCNSNPAEGWFGAMDADDARLFLTTASKGFTWQMINRSEGDPYVILDTDEFYRLLEYIPVWSNHAAYPQMDLGNAPEGFGGWSFEIFRDGKLLTLAYDPWMMGDLAHPDPNHWGSAVMPDWDIYPRPSSAEMGNTVGVVLDPFAIHNFPAQATAGNMTQEDAQTMLEICWEFAKFWCGDTRSWQARADQLWADYDSEGNYVLKTSLNDSLPLVTGAAFDEQMEIWYSVETHQRFADASKMPGFHAILELWERGDIWDVSDKAYPWRYEVEGSTREILFEYLNSWDASIVGASRTDANWLDNVKALMPDWNRQFNERFQQVVNRLEDAIARYY